MKVRRPSVDDFKTTMLVNIKAKLETSPNIRDVCEICAGRSGDLLSMIVLVTMPRDIKAKLETSPSLQYASPTLKGGENKRVANKVLISSAIRKLFKTIHGLFAVEGG